MSNIPCNFTVNSLPTHCPQCGAEYEHIQHPLKPLGVTMMSVCKCRPVVTTVAAGPNYAVQVVTMVPPDKP